MFDLEKTKTPQPAVIPKWMVMKVYDILDFYGIEYKEVGQNDFEEGWPGWAFFNGKTYSDGVCAVVTCVTPESLIKAAEEAHKMSPRWIKKYLTIKENGGEMPPYLDRMLNNITTPFRPVLEMTDTPETLIVPAHIKRDVDDLFKKRSISYEAVPQVEPHELSVIYHDRTYTTKLYAITSCVTSKSLYKALKDIDGLLPEEIE